MHRLIPPAQGSRATCEVWRLGVDPQVIGGVRPRASALVLFVPLEAVVQIVLAFAQPGLALVLHGLFHLCWICNVWRPVVARRSADGLAEFLILVFCISLPLRGEARLR